MALKAVIVVPDFSSPWLNATPKSAANARFFALAKEAAIPHNPPQSPRSHLMPQTP